MTIKSNELRDLDTDSASVSAISVEVKRMLASGKTEANLLEGAAGQLLFHISMLCSNYNQQRCDAAHHAASLATGYSRVAEYFKEGWNLPASEATSSAHRDFVLACDRADRTGTEIITLAYIAGVVKG
jgi:hypothetical protein